VRDIKTSRCIVVIAFSCPFTPVVGKQCPSQSVQMNHSVSSSSHSINGDISIQWEWSNFDHSQNQTP